jgi:hypothetical protein
VSLPYKIYAYIEEKNRKESRRQTETILTDKDKVQERIRPGRNNKNNAQNEKK